MNNTIQQETLVNVKLGEPGIEINERQIFLNQ